MLSLHLIPSLAALLYVHQEGTYSVNNLPAGITVTGWSTSNSSIATIAGNGNQATLTATGFGLVTVTAILTNSCNQPAPITTNNISVGSPAVTNYTMQGTYTNMSINSVGHFSVNGVPGATQYTWSVTPNTTCNAGSSPFVLPGTTNTYTSASRYADINMGACPGTYAVNCRAVNGCGTSQIATTFITVYDPNVNNPCGKTGSVKIVPNPVKGGNVTIHKYPPGDPCNRNAVTTVKKRIVNDVAIVDFYGNTVYKNSFDSETFDIYDLKLKRGTYVLQIVSSDGETIQELIIVE